MEGKRKRAKRRERGTRGNGTLVRPKVVNGTWGIRFTENGVRKYVGGYETEDKARHGLDVVAAQIRAGLPGVTDEQPKRTFGELWNDFMEYRQHHDEVRSVSDDRSRYRCHLEPLLERRDILDVDQALLSRLVVDLKKTVDVATVERVLHLLSGFYRWASMRGYADKNPVKAYFGGMSKPARAKLRSQHRPEDTKHLSDKADVAKLYQALPEPVATAYALSALAGLRTGEVVALEWADVDLNKGVIHVRRQERDGKTTVPKSGKARDVDIGKGLVALLLARRQREGLVCPPMAQATKAGAKVRRNRHGDAKFLNRRTIAKAMATALKACGLPAMGFYEAGRHSYGALWVLGGGDVYRLSKQLGHSSVVVTARYAHLSRATPASMLGAVDQALAATA